jgi:hypothetical protein
LFAEIFTVSGQQYSGQQIRGQKFVFSRLGIAELFWVSVEWILVMATGLRIEDRLDGAANFSSWKARIVLLFQENELWDIVEGTTATFTKKDIKAKRILFDAVKDHIIRHVSSKTYVHEMWTALKNLFQNSNENRKMVLREKLKSIKMTKSESVTGYLSRITQVRDELGAVGEVIPSAELVRTALNGVAKPWAVFVEGIVARENIPS